MLREGHVVDVLTVAFRWVSDIGTPVIIVPSAYLQNHHARRSRVHTVMLERAGSPQPENRVKRAYSELVPINAAMH